MKVADIKVELLGHYGSDWDVANAARVSFHKDADNYPRSDNEKLIRYLAKHKHHSPFNHCFLSFRLKAPIFVARQLVKHKFLPWNEVSRRYVDEEPEFYFTDLRERAENVKQGSGDVHEDSEAWVSAQKEHTKNQLAWYKMAIDCGVCPEQARMVLPQNTMTEWVWSGTLGAFLDMLVLRLDPHTQLETRETVKPIAAIIKEKFPISYGAYIDRD